MLKKIVEKYFIEKKIPYKRVSGYVDGDDSLGYDFEYKKNGIIHYVEVKSYLSGTFFITKNELETAYDLEEKYHIYLVSEREILELSEIFGKIKSIAKIY